MNRRKLILSALGFASTPQALALPGIRGQFMPDMVVNGLPIQIESDVELLGHNLLPEIRKLKIKVGNPYYPTTVAELLSRLNCLLRLDKQALGTNQYFLSGMGAIEGGQGIIAATTQQPNPVQIRDALNFVWVGCGEILTLEFLGPRFIPSF